MKDARLYLDHMLSAIQRIETYTAQGYEAFLADSMIQDAVSRNFEVIGEAAKRIPLEMRARFPAIPWTALTAFRDVLIHQYDRIDLGEVWRTVARDLPNLKPQIEAMLADLEARPGNEG